MSSETPEHELPILESPAEGVPPVIATEVELTAAIASLQAGTGPVAIDAERAQGFRYSGRAYLIQLRRSGSGTFLIDPTAFQGLAELGDAIADAEWIIHAATQDLPCLAAEGMVPTTIFDTELAGRLLG
ncbi:MAG: ribonuclease D, partial [Propionibacteriaceae bacterium]